MMQDCAKSYKEKNRLEFSVSRVLVIYRILRNVD